LRKASVELDEDVQHAVRPGEDEEQVRPLRGNGRHEHGSERCGSYLWWIVHALVSFLCCVTKKGQHLRWPVW